MMDSLRVTMTVDPELWRRHQQDAQSARNALSAFGSTCAATGGAALSNMAVSFAAFAPGLDYGQIAEAAEREQKRAIEVVRGEKEVKPT